MNSGMSNAVWHIALLIMAAVLSALGCDRTGVDSRASSAPRIGQPQGPRSVPTPTRPGARSSVAPDTVITTGAKHDAHSPVEEVRAPVVNHGGADLDPNNEVNTRVALKNVLAQAPAGRGSGLRRTSGARGDRLPSCQTPASAAS